MQLSFLNQAERGRNEMITYEMTFLMLIIGNIIGSLPLITYAINAGMQKGMSFVIALSSLETIMANPADYDLNTNTLFLMQLLTFVFALLGLWVGVKTLHKRAFISLINGFEQIRWSRFFTAAAVWFGITALMELCNYAMHPADYTLSFQAVPFFGTLAIALLILPFQTSCEELVFRGWLMQGIASVNFMRFFTGLIIWLSVLIPLFAIIYFLDLGELANQVYTLIFILSIFIRTFILSKQTRFEHSIISILTSVSIDNLKMKRWIPLLITSVLFGAMHFANPEVTKYGILPMAVYYIGFGLFMGLVALLDDGLELSLGLHFGNNFFGATMVSFTSSALQTNTLFRTTDPDAYTLLILSIVGATAAFFIFKKMYGFAPISTLFEERNVDTINNL